MEAVYRLELKVGSNSTKEEQTSVDRGRKLMQSWVDIEVLEDSAQKKRERFFTTGKFEF